MERKKQGLDNQNAASEKKDEYVDERFLSD